MSRAILQMALARTLHRSPTDAELTEYLAALRDLAGERVYIPQRQPNDPAEIERATELRGDGLSIRKIARAMGASKSRVHQLLSINSDLFVDSN